MNLQTTEEKHLTVKSMIEGNPAAFAARIYVPCHEKLSQRRKVETTESVRFPGAHLPCRPWPTNRRP